MLESRIYVGLSDKDSREQRYETERYKTAMKNVCRNYHTSFSLQVIEGGYYHDDGTWVDENTLLITLIGTPQKTVYEIAKDVCSFFNQESVMITCNPVLRFNVHDNLGAEQFFRQGRVLGRTGPNTVLTGDTE